MKMLYVTTIGITMSFFRELISELVLEGHQVDIACNELEYPVHQVFREIGCEVFQISFSRFPFTISNVSSVIKIKNIIINKKYDLVHCHTPVAAACTRIACMSLRNAHNLKVMYTTHGFHFYKNAPTINWALYYPIEWICAHWTDVIITINREDFCFAKKYMPAAKVEYVPGVGVDIERFEQSVSDRSIIRNQIGVDNKSFMLLSVGELNANKNHEAVIRMLSQIDYDNFIYVIAGEGSLKQHLETLAKNLGIGDRVILLGYRKDVVDLYHAADAYIHPSFREGLPVSIMEAMVCGLPIVCSRIRGNIDLVDQQGGILFNPYKVVELENAFFILLTSDLKAMGEYNRHKVQEYSTENVNRKMNDLYSSYIK